LTQQNQQQKAAENSLVVVDRKRSFFGRLIQGVEEPLPEKNNAKRGRGGSRSNTAGELVVVVNSAMQKEEQREICPLGVRCTSTDPLHFANYQHTDRNGELGSPKPTGMVHRFFGKRPQDAVDPLPPSLTASARGREELKFVHDAGGLLKRQEENLRTLEELVQRVRSLEGAEKLAHKRNNRLTQGNQRLLTYETKHNPVLVCLRRDPIYADLVHAATIRKAQPPHHLTTTPTTLTPQNIFCRLFFCFPWVPLCWPSLNWIATFFRGTSQYLPLLRNPLQPYPPHSPTLKRASRSPHSAVTPGE